VEKRRRVWLRKDAASVMAVFATLILFVMFCVTQLPHSNCFAASITVGPHFLAMNQKNYHVEITVFYCGPVHQSGISQNQSFVFEFIRLYSSIEVQFSNIGFRCALYSNRRSHQRTREGRTNG